MKGFSNASSQLIAFDEKFISHHSIDIIFVFITVETKLQFAYFIFVWIILLQILFFICSIL